MRSLLLCCVLIAGVTTAIAQTPSVLTLSQALELAEESNPALRTSRAALAAAEGDMQEASALLHDNPELTLENTRRRAAEPARPGTKYRESAVGISQVIELAGQPGYRRSAAAHALAAARAQVDNTRIQVRAEVESVFARVLLLQRRLASEEESLRLSREAADAIGKRVAAGEDSRLDGNLAGVEAERARSQVATVRDQLLEARGLLASLLQTPPAQLPEVAGDLPEELPQLGLDELLRRAAERPELRGLLEREAAAENRLKLERASAIPDLTVGLTSAREGPMETRERATTLSVSIPLPLFQRNQAAIGRALAERDQAAIERAAGRRDGEALVRELWQRSEVLAQRLARLHSDVLPRLDQNLELSRKGYEAGELGIVQVILVNRQVLEARREYLDALGEFTRVRIAVERTAGIHGAPSSSSHSIPIRKP